MGYKYGQELPADIEQKLDEYIERIKKINWFKPNNIDKTAIDNQMNVVLKAFGLEAKIEYRYLKTDKDWEAALNAAHDSDWKAAQKAARNAARKVARNAALEAALKAARDTAWNAARKVARNAAYDAALDISWGAALNAANDISWGASDLLAMQTDDYEYKTGNFIRLIPLWEAGLYPVGVIYGRFICCVPEGGEALLEETVSQKPHSVVIDGVTYVPED